VSARVVDLRVLCTMGALLSHMRLQCACGPTDTVAQTINTSDIQVNPILTAMQPPPGGAPGGEPPSPSYSLAGSVACLCPSSEFSELDDNFDFPLTFPTAIFSTATLNGDPTAPPPPPPMPVLKKRTSEGTEKRETTHALFFLP